MRPPPVGRTMTPAISHATAVHLGAHRATGANRRQDSVTDDRDNRGNRAHHTAGVRGADRGPWRHRPPRKSQELCRSYHWRSWRRSRALQRHSTATVVEAVQFIPQVRPHRLRTSLCLRITRTSRNLHKTHHVNTRSRFWTSLCRVDAP